MFRELSAEESKNLDERVRFLHGSRFAIDNLTAVLMDMSVGSFGMHEQAARDKAHAILDWLNIVAGIAVPVIRKE